MPKHILKFKEEIKTERTQLLAVVLKKITYQITGLIFVSHPRQKSTQNSAGICEQLR